MRLFPTLYKLDSKGKIRIWNIKANDPVGTYATEYGEQGGKMQTTEVRVESKNVGRSNETTVEEQAELEAESLWNKQQDKGYVRANGNAIKIDPFIPQLKDAKQHLPMLAKRFDEHYKKIKYPCYYQPKLNGHRCLSGAAGMGMWSRKGKHFTQLPHIKAALEPVLKQAGPHVSLDGELYHHGTGFQEISQITRQQKSPHPNHEILEYHIYDMFDLAHPNETFQDRHKRLHNLLSGCQLPLVEVDTFILDGELEVSQRLREYETNGYEGIMLRNADGKYEQDRRSENLQKVKSFKDEEFEIVGGKEGVGKFVGMCIFRCRAHNGKEFDVMPMGTEEVRRDYWRRLPDLIGQQLTVKYFNLSNDGIPVFPVGINLRLEGE